MPMPVFHSKRERRYWLYALAVVAAIYATLGVSPKIAGFLREHGLLEPAFAMGMILVVASIVTNGMKARPGGAEITVILGIAAVYMLLFVRLEASLEERTHLIEYGVVGVFVYEALSERARNGHSMMTPAVPAIAVTAAIGVLDECIQAILPNRVFDPQDILFNVLAGTMAVVACTVLAWVRKTWG
ncbi:VanZ family protein [Nitratireductor sp. XY-223]|uniref:VanZ family protein n=1 Tax=Nitratireductor sp. XY-223 TaxID=2561926 RepID=UPI0010AA5A96|nr:VanZ family protein [Nitratireductor sp. XY-223]